MPLHPFPSFTSVLSSNDTADLPDYYRTTRVEEYGPYYRSSGSSQDFMKRIDLHYDSREFSASFLLPDILEEHESDCDESVDDDTLYADHGVRPAATTPKTPRFVIRILMSVWRKCCVQRFISRHSRGHHRDDNNVPPTAGTQKPNDRRRGILSKLK